MHILIVDDIPQNRHLLETLLGAHGHTTHSATNGTEALATAGRQPLDLIISDILMPGMDGFTLCRALKQDPKLSAIPFIFYTATYTDERDAQLGLALGADSYLIKPMEPHDIMAAIARVIASPRPRVMPLPEAADPEYFQQYNARLIAKLEKKMLDLQQANEALKTEYSERERLTAQLQQSQKMEAVGRLAGGIAHDFNNILGGILGHAELARTEPNVPVAIIGHLDGIASATQRARDLVQHLLTFSRQKERQRAALNLPIAIGDALKLLRASLPASIEIVTDFAATIPAIIANVTELHQIVTNLVTNAWHAIGSEPGLITLRTGVKNIGEPPARYVTFDVSDDGSGMDEDTCAHIFEPFFSTKAPGKGCGLGLSVVHGIVESCGGTITVRSEPGEGSTFTLCFPAHEGAPADAGTEPAPQPVQGKGQRILFLDDDPTLVTLGQRFLTRLGYEAVVFSNPIEALTAFRDGQFDAVVTDLTMPYRNGIEVAHECRQHRLGIPIIVTTGYNPAVRNEDLRRQGIAEIILKPYTLQTLGEALAAVLGAKK